MERMISFPRLGLWVALGVGMTAIFHGCATQNLAMKPATLIQRDVFVCKGLSEDNRWVGITDQFLPDKDSRVVVVAFLDKQDSSKIVNFELVNPVDNVAASETLYFPKENPIGIYFSIPRLMKLGGEGEWKATVFADGEALGESRFYLGEKPEKKDEEAIQYFVVGDEDEEDADASAKALSEEDRFSTYIREVTPSLTIPLPTEPKPAAEIDSSNP